MEHLTPTLRHFAAVEVVPDRRVRAGIGVTVFILAVTLGAHITVPLTPGLGVIYLGGTAQLAVLSQSALSDVLAIGVIPFLLGDLIKVAVGVLLARRIRPTSLGRF